MECTQCQTTEQREETLSGSDTGDQTDQETRQDCSPTLGVLAWNRHTLLQTPAKNALSA
jgi:hypothetical protein